MDSYALADQFRRGFWPLSARVGELDALHAGLPMFILLAPVQTRPDADIITILDRIATANPPNRVGLVPSRASRSWRRLSDTGRSVLLDPCHDKHDDIDIAFHCVLNRRFSVPFAVWRCGSYLCIYCDHGVGDARLLQRLIALVTNPRTSADILMTGEATSRNPLSRALWGAALTEPRSLTRDARDVVSSTIRAVRSARSIDSSKSMSGLRREPATTLTAVFSSGSTVDEFREYRDATYPGLSITTLIMHGICQAFLSAGLNVGGSVDVPVDLRRYLPEGVTTHSNFQAVVRVPVRGGMTPNEFSCHLAEELTSFRPLLLLTRAIMRSKVQTLWNVARRRAVRPMPSRHGSSEHIALTLVDFTRFPRGVDAAWERKDGSELAGVLPPERFRQICVVLSRSGDDRMQVTATFYESEVAKGVVEEVIREAVLAPICRLRR